MIDRYRGCPLSPDLPHAQVFYKSFWDFIVGAFDFQLQLMARFEEDAVGADLDIKLINLPGFEQLPCGMQVDRLPRSGCVRVQPALGSAQPAPGA